MHVLVHAMNVSESASDRKTLAEQLVTVPLKRHTERRAYMRHAAAHAVLSKQCCAEPNCVPIAVLRTLPCPLHARTVCAASAALCKRYNVHAAASPQSSSACCSGNHRSLRHKSVACGAAAADLTLGLLTCTCSHDFQFRNPHHTHGNRDRPGKRVPAMGLASYTPACSHQSNSVTTWKHALSGATCQTASPGWSLHLKLSQRQLRTCTKGTCISNQHSERVLRSLDIESDGTLQ